MREVYSFVGNIPLALDLTNKLLEIFPAHPRALGNKMYYEEAIQRNNDVKRKGDDESADIVVNDQVFYSVHLLCKILLYLLQC